MLCVRVSLLCFALSASAASAQLAPEKPGVAVLPPPTDSWFLVNAEEGSYIFDGKSGEMLGLMSHQWYTPAAVTLPEREETYYIESFYSRGVRGKREDVLTVVDMKDLSPKAEIDIPDKAAALWFRHHIGLLGDKRHLLIFNMTPAQSLSVVDVVDREFDGEISTPGCAIIMPTGQRALMISGDGALRYILMRTATRNANGPALLRRGTGRYDKPVLTARLLISARASFTRSASRAAGSMSKPSRCSAPKTAAKNGGRAATSRLRCTGTPNSCMR
jgi:methylamine dehydrogenase heavy chain